MEVLELNNKKGFTLIEVLISIMILGFVIVSILSAFAQRMHTDKNNNFKNTAITLAEAKIEEYLKFPSSQIAAIYPVSPNTDVDYIIYHGGSQPIISEDAPDRNNQFRRTVEISTNGNLSTIRVTVAYGYVARNKNYPFSISLTTQRGL
jgi:prepilin-type N-terminal cleavage/methylation domain-containing protein